MGLHTHTKKANYLRVYLCLQCSLTCQILIVESVEQLAKCILSGLHAKSDIATNHTNFSYFYKMRERLTATVVTLPSFESFPVFHCLFLFLVFLFICCIFKSFLCLFIRVWICLSVAALQTRLKSGLGCQTPIFPEQNRALVICWGKHTAQAIPPDTIDRTIMSCEHSE